MNSPRSSGPGRLTATLRELCDGEPELQAVVERLAADGRVDLLELMRDYREGRAEQAILQRHGGAEAVRRRLLEIHALFRPAAEGCRRVMQQEQHARAFYQRLGQQKDACHSFLDDRTVPEEVRRRFGRVLKLARRKPPVEFVNLPRRLKLSAEAIERELLSLKSLFKKWADQRPRRRVDPGQGDDPGNARGGRSDE
jgi:hypothetical protein